MPTATSIAEVTQDYQFELFRTGSSSEIDSWASLIDANFLTAAQVAAAIAGSPESLDFVIPVEQLYAGVLGRVGDTGGMDAWVNALRSGTSFNTVVEDFVGSQEFINDYGATPNPTAFVTALYENILGRAPDSGGLAFWVGQLATENVATLAAVVEGFLGSPEAQADALKPIETYFTNAGETGTYATTITGLPGPAGTIVVPTGQTYVLTTGIDTINITTNTSDTVKGIIDQAAEHSGTTFTVGDSITGNGNTVVDIAVASLGASPSSAQFVTMSGVSTVNIFQAQTKTLDVNASSWGSVNHIDVTGSPGDVVITHLNITNGGGLALTMASTGSAYITASKGAVSGLKYDAEVGNDHGVGSVAKFGLNGIDVTLGKGGYLDLTLSQTAEHTAAEGAATVGNISLGHINVNVGASANAETVEVYNYASAHSHNATVGNIAVGNITYVTGLDGNANLTITNEAEAYGKGNATVGNVTVGNISVHQTGASGSFEGYVYNDAYAHTGNATVGNLTVGNVSLQGNDYVYLDLSQYARASDTGNATVGTVTVGNVAMVNGTSDDQYLYVDNEAYAYKGVAEVGNVSVGNVNMTASDYAYARIEQKAYVSDTGTATVGSIGVGNVTMNAKLTGENGLSIEQYATVDAGKGGAATVGNVTIGTVAMAVATSENYLYVYQEAYNYGSKAHNATVGNLTVGNITMAHNADLTGNTGGENYVYVDRSADAYHGNATVGNVSIGSVSINPGGVAVTGQTGASNYLYVYNQAYASHGIATAGTITIGNVSAQTGASGELDLYVYQRADGVSTADASGLVTVGNITMSGAGGAEMYATVYNYATDGAAGGITIGNVSLDGTKGVGTAELNVVQSGGNTGKITVGNIAITDQYLHLKVSNIATSGAAGGISVGNVSLKGDDDGGANLIYQDASNGTAGGVSVGNVTLSDHHGQTLYLDVSSYALNKVGAVGIGNVSIAMASTNKAANSAYAELYVETSSVNGKAGGNITTGNITIGSSGVTTKATSTHVMNGHVTLDAKDGNVVIGNITVTGGIANAAHAVLDNLATLTGWLHTTAGAGDTVTVGNIDYSGYAAAATIDVEDYVGAGSITGSTGGSIITDNKGTNAIIVSDTTKADTIYLDQTQSAVSDNGIAVTASQTAVDSITGFHSGDTIEFSNNAGGGTVIGAGGTGSIVQGASMSYATFLANAETQVDTDHVDVYSGDVGGNTYVALASSADIVKEIVEVVGIHTFTETAGILHFAT